MSKETKTPPFVMLPRCVFLDSLRLGHWGRLMYCALVMRCNGKGQTWVGSYRLARDMGCRARTARRALRELVEAGLVTTRRRRKGQSTLKTILPLSRAYSEAEIYARLGVECPARLDSDLSPNRGTRGTGPDTNRGPEGTGPDVDRCLEGPSTEALVTPPWGPEGTSTEAWVAGQKYIEKNEVDVEGGPPEEAPVRGAGRRAPHDPETEGDKMHDHDDDRDPDPEAMRRRSPDVRKPAAKDPQPDTSDDDAFKARHGPEWEEPADVKAAKRGESIQEAADRQAREDQATADDYAALEQELNAKHGRPDAKG